MGFYLECDGQRYKEPWLLEHGGRVVDPVDATMQLVNGDGKHAVIVVIDNIMFHAAAIAFDVKEFSRLTEHDGSSKTCYLILWERIKNDPVVKLLKQGCDDDNEETVPEM